MRADPAATCDNLYVGEREDEDIESEPDRLRREVDALRLEHAALERKPVAFTSNSSLATGAY